MFPVTRLPIQTLPNNAHSDEKLFVMTDLHGSFQAMQRLLAYKPDDARLVFLGDSTDRGPSSVAVLTTLHETPDAVLLRGNHDIMAWYSLHDDPQMTPGHLYKLRELWLEYNGGMRTVEDFLHAEGKEHLAHRDFAEFFKQGRSNPVFEAVYAKSQRFWKSGNLFFIHGGLPYGQEDKWLTKPDIEAVSMRWDTEEHWAWYRPHEQRDGWYEKRQRYVQDEPVYIVCGHTGQPYDALMYPYGLFLDTGYMLKTAAIIDGDSIQLIMTPCDEVVKPEKNILKIFE